MEGGHELQLRLRKHRDNLVVNGYGVIAFGVWSVIKAVLYTALNTEALPAEITEDGLMKLAFWAFMAVFLAIDLVLRLRVGLSAIAEGRGRKKRVAYIILALLMAVVSFALLAGGLYLLPSSEESLGKALVAFAVELTSGIVLMEMAGSAIQVKRLSKKLAEGER